MVVKRLRVSSYCYFSNCLPIWKLSVIGMCVVWIVVRLLRNRAMMLSVKWRDEWVWCNIGAVDDIIKNAIVVEWTVLSLILSRIRCVF